MHGTMNTKQTGVVAEENKDIPSWCYEGNQRYTELVLLRKLKPY